MLRFTALGTAKRNTAAKRKTMLRFARPPLRFESYAVQIVTICVMFFFRFWEMLRFAALQPVSSRTTSSFFSRTAVNLPFSAKDGFRRIFKSKLLFFGWGKHAVNS